MSKECNGCMPKTEDGFALQLLKDYSKQAHKWFVIALVILAMWLTTIGGFVWFLSQYNFESESVIVEQDGEGINNYIGQDGDITNGTEDNS